MLTSKDIIKAGKVKVRNSPSLYPAYQQMFKNAFGYFPECPTCGSAQGHRDWAAFEHYVNYNTIQPTKKIDPMATNKTFVLRDKYKIYTLDYKHPNGRILRKRVFGQSMDEAWAKEYLANADGIASEKEMEARKAEFKVLPQSISEAKAKSGANADSALKDLKVSELKNMLAKMDVPESEFSKLKKDELIALIEVIQLEQEDDLDGPNGTESDASKEESNEENDSLLD